MKNILKLLIIILLVFILLLIGKLVYDKIVYEKKLDNTDYKISDDIYFSDGENDLVLYRNNTFFMYKDNEYITGSYLIDKKQINFTALNKYGDYCFENYNKNFIGKINGKNEIESITIDNIVLNKTDTELEKERYIIDKENCNLVKTINTSYEDYGINISHSHYILIENKINYNSNVDDKKELNEFLKEFFDRYFNIMETLEYKDISDMFDNDENAYIYKTALELLIENRKRNENDLSISDPIYELTIQDYKKNGDEISFMALETCEYKFNFIRQYTTSVYNIKNEFKLIKKDGKYKIKSYNKVQDFYVMITGVYKSTTDYKKSLDNIKSDYLKKFDSIQEKHKKMKEDYLNKNYEIKKCDNKIDRKKAYSYATSWVGERNNDNYKSHGSSNCVNYASQVMAAGGVPMDSVGEYKWYSYNKGASESFSWINVGGIIDYFKNNTGYGLCGKYDENIYLGEPGDIVTVGYKSDQKHATSVISQIKDLNGNVIDLLVSSNTVDLFNYPLSAYAYPYKSLLKVYGYNN